MGFAKIVTFVTSAGGVVSVSKLENIDAYVKNIVKIIE